MTSITIMLWEIPRVSSSRTANGH